MILFSIILISSVLSWIAYYNPIWLTNHWNHWLFGNFFDDENN